MNEQDVKRAILVVQQGMTSFAKQAIANVCAKETDLRLECFQESELLVNITKHVLVPQHKVLTNEVRAAALPPSDAAAPHDAPARLCVAGEIHPTGPVQAEAGAAASGPVERPRGEILRAKPRPGGQDRATQRDGRQIRHLPIGRLASGSARPLARSLCLSSSLCASCSLWVESVWVLVLEVHQMVGQDFRVQMRDTASASDAAQAPLALLADEAPAGALVSHHNREGF